MSDQQKERTVLSEKVWPVIRVLIVQAILFIGILGNLAAWGVFVLVIDKLHWMDVDFHGKTLETISPDGRVLGICVLILTNLVLVLLAWRVLERKRISEMLLDFKNRWGRALGWGLAAGLAEVILVYGILWISGVVEVDLGLHRVDGGVWGVAFGWLLGSSILAPISEEVWYRGYIFQNIKRGWGVAAGVVVNALVFGGLHLLNPNAELLGAVNIMLSAVIWTLGLLWFKSLWFPIGWHAAWNFAQFFFMGLPNSGYTVSDLGLNGTTLLVSELSGADWLVGGEFGMEASGVKTIVLLAALVVMVIVKKKD
jgi:membrane protease YdiL (CAAX protease family)